MDLHRYTESNIRTQRLIRRTRASISVWIIVKYKYPPRSARLIRQTQLLEVDWVKKYPCDKHGRLPTVRVPGNCVWYPPQSHSLLFRWKFEPIMDAIQLMTEFRWWVMFLVRFIFLHVANGGKDGIVMLNTSHFKRSCAGVILIDSGYSKKHLKKREKTREISSLGVVVFILVHFKRGAAESPPCVCGIVANGPIVNLFIDLFLLQLEKKIMKLRVGTPKKVTLSCRCSQL